MPALNSYIHHLATLLVIYSQTHHSKADHDEDLKQAILGLIREFNRAQSEKRAPVWEPSADFRLFLTRTSAIKKLPTLFHEFVRQYAISQAGVGLHAYLLALQDSGRLPVTIKNYRSDIGQFLTFHSNKSLDAIVQKSEVIRFVEFEKNRGSSETTIRRKLVSVGQFCNWLSENGWISSPAWTSTTPTAFTDLLKNTQVVSSLINTPFKHQEESETVEGTHGRLPVWTLPLQRVDVSRYLPNVGTISTSTAPLKKSIFSQIKLFSKNTPMLGYLNLAMGLIFLATTGFLGYRQFFSEAESPLAFPTSLTRPNRSLSFQGRLTNTDRTPITALTPMRFRLYDSGPSGGSGTLLWDSTNCNIDPDQDGIFSTTLGDSCGAEISSDVFSENSNVWLEVEVNSEILEPRQPIKSVAYALNSETLQGYPASASAVENTVLVMRNDGKVVFGNANPILEATGDSFAITAKTLTLETSSGSNGNVIINPDGTGQTLINSNTLIEGYLSAPGATLSATYAGGTALTLKAGPLATADILQWQNSGGGALGVIDESGNVGIGTSNPSYSLDVVGNIRSTQNSYFATTGGNVGIGTTSPSQKLDVAGDAEIANYLYFNNGTTNYLRNDGSDFILSNDLLPSANNTYNLGASGTRWANIYGTNLYQNGNQVCDASGNCGPASNWTMNLGAIYPNNSTLDMLIGGTSTASAKFAFLNVNSGTPTASIAGNLAIAAPTGTNPATSTNIYNGGSYSIKTSVGGDAGLLNRFTILNNGNVGIGTTSPTAKLTIQASSSAASLGSELLITTEDRDFSSSSGNWSGTNWTIGSGVATHTAGANSFIHTLTPTATRTYQILATINTTTAGKIYAQFGAASGSSVGTTVGTLTQHSWVITATDTTSLRFIPDGAWAGTIDDVSVKEITQSSAIASLLDSNAYPFLEFRGLTSSGDSENIALGRNSIMSNITGIRNTSLGSRTLEYNTTGNSNVAIGYRTLRLNTTGSGNSAVGQYSLLYNTTGSNNSAFGISSLSDNTTGSGNTASGLNALLRNKSGDFNVALGYTAMQLNTSGSNNTAVGLRALERNTTGSMNIALGYWAGRLQADGVTDLANPENSIYIGSGSRGYNNDDDNSIVIGYNAIGLGANTAVFGNDSITTTALKGNVGIGTTAPSQKLEVAGNMRTTGYLYFDNPTGSDLFIRRSAVNTMTLWAGSGPMTWQGTNLTLGQWGSDVTLSGPDAGVADRNGQWLNVRSGTSWGSGTAAGLKFLYSPTGAGGGGTNGYVEGMRLDGTGNVGIGTTSPNTKLHLLGDLTITGGIRPATDGTTALQLQKANGTSVLDVDTTNSNVLVSGKLIANGFVIDKTNQDMLISRHTGGEVAFRSQTTNGRSQIILSPNGAPTYSRARMMFGLTDIIADPTNVENMTFAARGDTNEYWISTEAIGTGTARPIVFKRYQQGASPSTIDIMRLMTDGNVGIGTTTVPDLLTVRTTTNDVGITLAGASSGVSPTYKLADSGGTVHARIGIAGAAGNLVTNASINDLVFRNNAKNIHFTTDNGTSTSLFVGSNGRVGIGTTSPSALIHGIKTTEQLRLGYDASNYYSTTVSSAGGVTFDAVGISSGFTFSDYVGMAGSGLELSSTTSFSKSSGSGSFSFSTNTGNKGIEFVNSGATTGTDSGFDYSSGVTTGRGMSITANSLTSGSGIYASSSSLTSGSLMNLVVTGSGAASSSQKVLNISNSGTNGTTETTYGAYVTNTRTGEGGDTNVAGYFSASGAASNYGLIVASGNMGIGTTAPGAMLQLGTAASTLGTLRLTGNTSGYTQIQPSAAAGSWTMTLPTGVGSNGQQLTTNGSGVTSWTAANSLRTTKNILGTMDASVALDTLVNAQVYRFNYKPGMGTGDSETEYVGIMADEAPWAMHYDGAIVNPVNTLGYAILGVQALNQKNTQLENSLNQVSAKLTDYTELSIDQFGVLEVVEADNATYQVVDSTTATPINDRFAAFTRTITAIVEAGLTRTRELVVTGQAQIADLSVGNLSINGQGLRDYIVSVIQENQATNSVIVEVSPTPAPVATATESAWLAEVFQREPTTGEPMVEDLSVTDLLTTQSIEATSVTTEGLSVTGQTQLGSLLVSGNASVAGVMTVNELGATSARIDALEAGIAQLESVKATTAEFANATVSGTLYAQTIADLDKQIAQLLEEPTLLEVFTGAIPQPQTDYTQLYQAIGSITTTASQAAELDQSIGDLGLIDSDVILTADAGFIDRYFKINGIAYVADKLGVGNALAVGNKLEITDSYLSFSADPANPDSDPFFMIQPSGKGLLAMMGDLLLLDGSGQVTINGNLRVAGNITVEGSLLTNVLEPIEAGGTLSLNLGQTALGEDATLSGDLASPSARFEVLGFGGTPVATVSAQGKASFTGLSLGRDLLERPQVAGVATQSSELTQEATQTTGRAILPAGNRELTINNPNVRADSLIYLTPLGSTNNQVLYVKQVSAPDQETEAALATQSGVLAPTRSFTIGLDAPALTDISFTWWIVN